MSKKTITTSIAYINAEPHIGFLFELVAADVLARYQRLQGDEVFFLTGTDEHGTKVEQAAKAANQEPKAFADSIAAKFEALTKDFNISNDFFIRTTDPNHVEFVKNAWNKLKTAGVLEKKTYSGFYCTGCEAFKTEREIIDGKCVIHETAVEKIEEENWFFNISKFKSQISKWIETAVFPNSKRTEVINILEDFNEVSVSRPKSKLGWGIEVPDDSDQVLYVWIDALLNYLSGIEASGRKIADFWPGTQLIGKDILKFHAIIWPALLLALGYKLPEKLLVHGWISVDGKKISKSLGNVITPAELKERYGVDGARYLLLRQLNFYDDSNFVWSEFDSLYNGELANGLGNLVARAITLLKKYDGAGAVHEALKNKEKEEKYIETGLEEYDFRGELVNINDQIGIADAWFSKTRPWEWESPTSEQKALLIEGSRLLKIVDLIEPFIPATAAEIRRQLTELDPKPLFPRIEG